MRHATPDATSGVDDGPGHAWVVVDVQHAFDCPATVDLAAAITAAIRRQPGPVYALVQTNPPGGPLRTLRGWHGAGTDSETRLLSPLNATGAAVYAKTGYGAASPLPVDELRRYRTVYLTGVDTDACVLATAYALFDAGVNVTVLTDLCWSAGGPDLHEAALTILRRQLGPGRVTDLR